MKLSKTFLTLTIIVLSINIISANETPANRFFIIPEATSGGKVTNAVTDVSQRTTGTIRDRYNKYTTGEKKLSLEDQLASGIMSRETLIDYLIYLVRFISQAGLAIGALMIIYAGYIYAISIFSGGDASKGNNAIKYAIQGIVVIASSYAIIRILTTAFLS